MDKNTKETLLGIDLYKNLSREELILGLLASTAREDEMKPRKVFVEAAEMEKIDDVLRCLLYTSPSPRDRQKSRMPSSA